MDFFEKYKSESLYSEERVQKRRRFGWWRDMTLGDYLDWHARERGDQLAVVDDHRSLTWSDLRTEADRVAAALERCGVSKGDRVCLLLPNRAEWFVARLGIARCGAVAVVMYPRFRRQEIEHVVEQVEPIGFVASSEYKNYDHVGIARDVRSETHALEIIIDTGESPPADVTPMDEVLQAETDGFSPTRIDPDLPTRLHLSSGTTGDPKIIYYVQQFETMARHVAYGKWAISQHDTLLVLSSIAHGVGAVPGFFSQMLTGATTVVTEHSNAPSEHRERIAEHGPDVVTAVPTQLNKLQDQIPPDSSLFEPTRLLTWGGEKMAEDRIRYFEDLGPSVVAIYGFGLGGGPFASSPADKSEYRAQTVGRQSVGTEIKIVDEDGSEVPTGEVGELAWKGPCVSFGYFDDPELTKEVTEIDDDGDIWAFSSDTASIDERGYVTIHGRVDDMIIRGGQNVFPAEIEEALATHDQVSQVAVAGIPDEEYGQRVCAFVVSEPGERPSLDDLTAFLDEEGLAKYKWHERLEHLEELPVNATGKVDKSALKERI